MLMLLRRLDSFRGASVWACLRDLVFDYWLRLRNWHFLRA